MVGKLRNDRLYYFDDGFVLLCRFMVILRNSYQLFFISMFSCTRALCLPLFYVRLDSSLDRIARPQRLSSCRVASSFSIGDVLFQFITLFQYLEATHSPCKFLAIVLSGRRSRCRNTLLSLTQCAAEQLNSLVTRLLNSDRQESLFVSLSCSRSCGQASTFAVASRARAGLSHFVMCQSRRRHFDGFAHA